MKKGKWKWNENLNQKKINSVGFCDLQIPKYYKKNINWNFFLENITSMKRGNFLKEKVTRKKWDLPHPPHLLYRVVFS